MRTQKTRSKQGEPAMDYRSPTIHSFILLMAGSPFLHSHTKVNKEKTDVRTATIKLTAIRAVVKAIFVSANLSAMTAAFFL